MTTEREIGQKLDLSLPPEYFLLALLDQAKGNPVTIEDLRQSYSERVAQAIKAGSDLARCIDLEEVDVIVEGSLDYMRRLRLVEDVPGAEDRQPASVRITALGSLMALEDAQPNTPQSDT